MKIEKSNLKNTLVAVGITTLVFASCAYAGTNTDFGSAETKLVAWLNGSMGRMFAVGSLGVGLAIGIVKQSVMSVAVGTGIALAALIGPGIFQTVVNATI